MHCYVLFIQIHNKRTRERKSYAELGHDCITKRVTNETIQNLDGELASKDIGDNNNFIVSLLEYELRTYIQ